MSFFPLVFLPFIVVLILVPYWLSINESKKEDNENEIEDQSEYNDQSMN